VSLHREQIHTLLAEIDGVLNKDSPRLPWVMSSEVNRQRQTLKHLRHYLVSLEQNIGTVAPGQSDPSEAYWSAPAPSTHLEISSTVTAELIENATTPQMALNLSQQMIQQFAQDIGQLRSSLLHPLHTELGRLQQQRDTLLQEIRQLERQRQQHSLVQQRASQEQVMQDFLQGLMERLQERLSQQISQMVNSSAVSQGFSPLSLGDLGQNLAPLLPQEAGLPPLPPAQRMEQAQMLQSRADQVMVTLDTTLRVFAEALQQNIQSYESSLAQGLEKMHRMGQQGEAIVSSLVQKLADQVSGQVSLNEGETASSRSLSSSTPPVTQTNPGRFSSLPALPVGQMTTLTAPKLPYAGAEIPDRSPSRLPPPARPSVTATPSFPNPPQELKPPVPLSSGFSAPKAPAVVDLGLGDSDLENLDWDGAEADLELDLDLLDLENSPIVSETVSNAEPEGVNEGVVNEELDAFYASLFGDQTAPPPIALDEEMGDEELGDGLDLSSPADSPREGQVSEGDDRIPATQDFFADLGTSDLLELETFSFETLGFDAPSSEVSSSEAPESEPPGFLANETETQDFFADFSNETIVKTIAESEPLTEALKEALTEPVDPTILDFSNPSLSSDPLEFAPDPALAELEQALQAVMIPIDRDLQESPLPPQPISPETDGLPDRGASLASIPGSQLAMIPQPQISPQISPDPALVSKEDIITALTDLLEQSLSIVPSSVSPTAKTIAPGTSQPGSSQPSMSRVGINQPASNQPTGNQKVTPEDNLRTGDEETYPPALPEESLLVKEDGDESIKTELALEPETLQQLREDLSNLERQENLRLEDVTNLPLSDVFGANTIASAPVDPLADPFADFNDDALSEVFNSGEVLDIDLLEDDEAEPSLSSAPERLAPPAESLLPEPEEGDVDWLTQEPQIQKSIQESVDSRRHELPNRELPNYELSNIDHLSLARIAEFFPDTNPFEDMNTSDAVSPRSVSQTLNQPLDNDPSFTDPSLSDLSDWFQTPALETIERSSLESRRSTLLADDLFEDLPNAEEKKNDSP